nr:Chain C, 11-mer peptide F11V [Toxoplasma gondii]
FVLELEPEWTV